MRPGLSLSVAGAWSWQGLRAWVSLDPKVRAVACRGHRYRKVPTKEWPNMSPRKYLFGIRLF